MTTAPNFNHFKMNDYRAPLSLEEVFRLFGSWSDIHQYKFDQTYQNASLTVTGTVAATWTDTKLTLAQLPSSFEIRYHKVAHRQAINIYIDSTVYTVGTDASGYPFANANGSLLESVPKACPQVADVVLVFRQQQFENDASSGTSPTASNIVWYSVSLYMNRHLEYVFTIGADATSTVTQIGFAAYGTDVVVYTNIVIPDLPETAEFGTLDQGEVPYSGLQRTIDGRYLRLFVRYDGTFRAFRTKSVSISQALTDPEFYVTQQINDTTDLITHCRMVGAYIWDEYFDEALTKKYGHRFQEVNNPMLITDGECEIEAQRTIIRSKESAFQESVSLPFLPLVEPEDRITTPQGDWLLTDIEYTLEDNGAATAQATFRLYGWG